MEAPQYVRTSRYMQIVGRTRGQLVADLQRYIDRVYAAALKAGVRIPHPGETHLHNDYVSGGQCSPVEPAARLGRPDRPDQSERHR